MECNVARKKLKDFAKGDIIDMEEKKELEEHIKDCAICKRELYMWQEVVEKQRVISNLQSNLSPSLRSRIKYRLNQMQNEEVLPPSIHKLRAIERIWSGTKGRLIIEILIILSSLIILFKYMHGGKNLIVPFLILFGFVVLIVIMLKGRKEK